MPHMERVRLVHPDLPGQPEITVPPRGVDVRLRKGWLVKVDDGTTADGLDDLKVDELRAVADAEGVEVDSAARKADLIAAIRDHRSPEG